LSNDEKDELKMEWIRKTIKRSELIEKRFWEENKKK
jgi:tRNA (guanosine-2'-O-)-methyltransferase